MVEVKELTQIEENVLKVAFRTICTAVIAGQGEAEPQANNRTLTPLSKKYHQSLHEEHKETFQVWHNANKRRRLNFQG